MGVLFEDEAKLTLAQLSVQVTDFKEVAIRIERTILAHTTLVALAELIVLVAHTVTMSAAGEGVHLEETVVVIVVLSTLHLRALQVLRASITKPTSTLIVDAHFVQVTLPTQR